MKLEELIIEDLRYIEFTQNIDSEVINVDLIALVGTPGEGFGENGKNWFRLTSFNTIEKTREAVDRVYNYFKG